MERPRGGARLFDAHRPRARTIRARPVELGPKPFGSQKRALVRIDRRGIFTSLAKIVDATKKTQMEMVVVGRPWLTHHHLEPRERRGIAAHLLPMLEDEGPKVLGDKDALKSGFLVEGERFEESESARHIEPYFYIVRGIGRIAKIHPLAARIEDGGDGWHWLPFLVE